MVQEVQPTERHWREQTGAGATSPPQRDYSTSEGDKNRSSLGPSRYSRTFVRYVANDDGTPIAEGTDKLLEAILVELKAIHAALEARDAVRS